MINKILITLILVLFVPSLVQAENVGDSTKKWFINYSNKIDLKYNDKDEIIFLKNLNTKLDIFLSKKSLTNTQKVVIKDLIKLSNERIFNKEFEKEQSINKKIINSNGLLSKFKNKSLNKEHIFLENGIWYSYIFDRYLIFPKGIKLKESDLKHNGIDLQKSLVYVMADGNIGFVTNYSKVKLISDNIVYGVAGKYNFLKEVKDDKKTLRNETDLYFEELKKITLDLTEGKSRENKIKAIYNYVLENISYTLNFSLDDSRIFSGIDTYINNNGVCEGYVKIFLFMLNFANIDDSEVIRGYVIDAEDFPQIGHAWVKIGNKYYDPTFDDPIGKETTSTFSEYKYFGLPYDLFYTNRYTYEKLPSFLKKKSLEYRKQLIIKKTVPLVNKYKDSSFNILKPYVFKVNNGIKANEQITLEHLKTLIPYNEVVNYKTNVDGINKQIKKIQYFNISNSNIENIIFQINYELEGYYLFKWKLKNGDYEYRLSYNVEFH